MSGVQAPARAPQHTVRGPRGAFWRWTRYACIAVSGAALLLAYLPVVTIDQDELPSAFSSLYRDFFDEESIASVTTEKERFLSLHADEYGYNGTLESIVRTELAHTRGHVYVDYTGSAVYQQSQLRRTYEDLSNNLYGNAHSRNPSAQRTDVNIQRARNLILEHFGTSSKDYTVIFTSGTTGALKLVAESFPWTSNSKFVYLRQNHNSVLGMREIARDQLASFATVEEADLADDSCNKFFGGQPCDVGTTKRNVMLTEFPNATFNLFAYPAEDNFAGVKYPLEWVNMFRRRDRGEKGTGQWLILLDAAAFVPTNELNLSEYPFDFVAVSFYKMFGYPTGLGALIVRNEATEIMQKTFFGGGAVVASSWDQPFCLLKNSPCERFEDGTLSFLSIVALQYGFEALHRVPMAAVERHVHALAAYMHERLTALRHHNGAPVVVVYGSGWAADRADADAGASMLAGWIPRQGGIINFNVRRADGSYVAYTDVQDRSSAAKIHLRTGCVCNPGACLGYLGISTAEAQELSLGRTSCGDDMATTPDGRPLGSVRVSIGYLSTFEDVLAVVKFVERNYVEVD